MISRWCAPLAFCLALTGCGEPAPPTPPPSPPMKIRFVTDWRAEAEHGGFYEAKALGLYTKHHLDVTIIQGGPSVNVPQMLTGGAADFGIASNAFIPFNLAAQSIPIKAVMAIFQKDPQVLITHPRKDVKSIADMKGKPIMVSDATVATFWQWLKAKYGFTDKQIRKYTFNLAPFLTNPKAIQQGYVTSEPYLIEKEGEFKPQVFLLADNGYPGYANMVLAPDSWIEQKPQVVQDFVEATAEGWMHYLYGDPAPADALIKKDNPEMTDDVLAQARQKMRDYGLVLSGDALKDGVGAMHEARWNDFYVTMTAQGVYYLEIPWHDAFTTRFIDRGYGLDLLPKNAGGQAAGGAALEGAGGVKAPADGQASATRP